MQLVSIYCQPVHGTHCEVVHHKGDTARQCKSDQSRSCGLPKHPHTFRFRHVDSTTRHASVLVAYTLHPRLDIVERHARISIPSLASLVRNQVSIYSHSQNTTTRSRHKRRRRPSHLLRPSRPQSISNSIERRKSNSRVCSLFTQHRRQSLPQTQHSFSSHNL